MTSQNNSPDAVITITDAAAIALGKLIASSGNLSKNFRVFIKGGGCSGYSYEYEFDETVNEDDEVIESNIILEDLLETPATTRTKFKVIVDPICLNLLRGTEIDYAETAKGPELIFRNPNAKTTCGCGSSFSVGS